MHERAGATRWPDAYVRWRTYPSSTKPYLALIADTAYKLGIDAGKPARWKGRVAEARALGIARLDHEAADHAGKIDAIDTLQVTQEPAA